MAFGEPDDSAAGAAGVALGSAVVAPVAAGIDSGEVMTGSGI